MSIIARRFILARNVNISKCLTASLTNIASKKHGLNTLNQSQNAVKKINLDCLRASYTTNSVQTEDINNRIKLLLKGDKVVLFIKGIFQPLHADAVAIPHIIFIYTITP